MFQSCPHCHDLVSIGPPSTPRDTLCPRCGGVLQTAATAAEQAPPPAASWRPSPSLASFLRPRAEPVVEAATQAPETAQDSKLTAASPPAGGEAEPVAPVRVADTAHADDPRTEAEDASASSAVAMHGAAQGEPTPANASAPPESMGPDESDAVIAIAGEARDESSSTASPADPATGLPAADGTDGSVPSEPVDGEATDASPAAVATSAAAAETTTAPSFSQGTRVVQSGTAPWQWAAMGVLVVALLVQVMLADRARLASDPAWRPLLANLCGILGCSLPAWREPAAFTMLSRDVRPLSGVPGALQAQATFRNEARWTQAWPMLWVSLSDADGRVVGARVFRPEEYLADAPPGGVAPGQSAQVVLQLREPEAGVVAFAFDFR